MPDPNALAAFAARLTRGTLPAGAGAAIRTQAAALVAAGVDPGLAHKVAAWRVLNPTEPLPPDLQAALPDPPSP